MVGEYQAPLGRKARCPTSPLLAVASREEFLARNGVPGPVRLHGPALRRPSSDALSPLLSRATYPTSLAGDLPTHPGPAGRLAVETTSCLVHVPPSWAAVVRPALCVRRLPC